MNSFFGLAVQAVLQSDKGVGSPPGGSLNFERWIKHGLMADDLLNSSNDSEELLLQGSSSGCTACEHQCTLAERKQQGFVVLKGCSSVPLKYFLCSTRCSRLPCLCYH